MGTKIIAVSARVHLTGVLLLCAFLISGCDTALTVGGRTIGVRSGHFLFTDGYLATNYNYSLKEVWKACEQVMTEMKATGIEKNLKIAKGTINAFAHDEKIQILVEYVSKEQTSVSIRVGLSGNNMASQLIHEKIANSLLRSEVKATQ
jgi:hypothetical protein